MSLFNRKKKDDRVLPLPEFPRLPNESSFPFYDEQIAEKQEQQAQSPFKSDFKKIVPTGDFSFEPKQEKQDFNFEEFSPRKSPLVLEKRDDKPLFVKVEKYRETVKTIENIKSKLEEAESIFKNLTSLREQEDKELQEWQASLDEIRQKLMKVDKDLFEV